MPLLQYFAWVGGFLLAALLLRTGAALRPLPLRHLPTFRSIRRSTSGSNRNINGLNASYLTRTVRSWHPKQQSPRRQTFRQARFLAGAGNQATDAFAEMTTTPARPCFRPTCSGGQAAQRAALPAETHGPVQRRSRSSMAAGRGPT